MRKVFLDDLPKWGKGNIAKVLPLNISIANIYSLNMV